MVNNKRNDPRPTAVNVDFPVFIPNEKGETKIEIGKARLRYGTLVVEFRDTAGAVAIQRMIERGVLLGLGMIMVKPDEINLQYQGVVETEELEKDLKPLLEAEDKKLMDEYEHTQNLEARSDEVEGA